jgi:hypothetical protein
MMTVEDHRAHFTFDARKSLFTVREFAAGIATVVAHIPRFAIRDFAGELKCSPGTTDKASVRLTINVASLEIIDEVRKLERRDNERVMFDEELE